MADALENKDLKTEVIHSPFAADEEKPYIFVSYAHADSDRVFPIITRLYEQGWRIWYDQGLEIGGNYYDCLAEHIGGCAAVLLMATEASVKSKFVTENELEFALTEGRRIVICRLDKDAMLPGGIRLATAKEDKHPRCTQETLEQTLAGNDGLERGQPRRAKGIVINAVGLTDTTVSDGDEYEAIAVTNGIRLTNYLGSETEVVIPSVYKGKRVVELVGTFIGNESVKSVTIPDSVTDISWSVFEDCKSLERVNIPNSVTSIGGGAFRECTSLTSVNIPDSVTSIGGGTFSGCTGLTSVNIPNSVTSISGFAFTGCTGLAEIAIPASVTTIGDDVFEGCEPVIRCAPGSVAQKFAEQSMLDFIPDESLCTAAPKPEAEASGAKAKAADAQEKKPKFLFISYAGAEAAQAAEIIGALREKGVAVRTQEDAASEYERSEMLLDCGCFAALVSREFIEKKMTVQIETAEKLAKPFVIYMLEECTLPAELGFRYDAIQQLRWHNPFDENIARLAGFADKNGCVEVRLPFDYITDGNGLTVFKWHGEEPELEIEREYRGVPVVSIGDGAFYGCNSLVSVTVPDSVTGIGKLAFSCCRGLESASIPDSVTSIGGFAFDNCRALTVYCNPGSYAWRYCEQIGIPHKPLEKKPEKTGSAQTRTPAKRKPSRKSAASAGNAAPSDEPLPAIHAVTADEIQPAEQPRKRRSPLAWLIPLIILLLAAGAAWYLGGLDWLLGLLG